MSQQDEYKYLWDGTEEGWCLLKSDTDPSLTIFNIKTSVALLVEDETLKAELCRKMQKHGVETIDKIEQHDVEVTETGESAEDFFRNQNK